jgi:hypothetical protein
MQSPFEILRSRGGVAMAVEVEMPAVAECGASECAYNVDGSCHARAITIGDGVHPGCDTFLAAPRHSRSLRTAGVGACKVVGCRHNDDFECQAQSISVDRRSDGVECTTFEQR